MNPRALFGLFARPAILVWGLVVVSTLVVQALVGTLMSPIGALLSGFVAGAVVSRRLEELRRSTMAWSLPGLRTAFALPAVILGFVMGGLGALVQEIGQRLWHSPGHGSLLALAAFILLGYGLAFAVEVGLSLRLRRWLVGILLAWYVLGPLVRIRLEWVLWLFEQPTLGPVVSVLLEAPFVLPRSEVFAVAAAAFALGLLAWAQRVETWR